MEKGLVKNLTDFGLSVNQAKVYLSIIHLGPATVNSISKDTGLHQQDIYKILPKLEETGLIIQTLSRPVTLDVISVEEALKNFVKIEKKKNDDRIKRLKAGIETLAKVINEEKKANDAISLIERAEVAYFSSDRAIKNKLDAAYKNVKTQCDLVLNYELLMRRLPLLRKRFEELSNKNIKTRILLDATQDPQLMKKIFEEILPDTGNFKVKLTAGKITVRPYTLIDRSETYVFTQGKTQSFMPTMLWTNGKNIFTIYEHNFENAWNSRFTISVYPAKKAIVQ
jgi:sugar-specific transcriptional regulator TrmB